VYFKVFEQGCLFALEVLSMGIVLSLRGITLASGNHLQA
jgi:hypothetical protein